MPAMLPRRLLSEKPKDSVQPHNLTLGLFEVVGENLRELRIHRTLCQLWQRLYQLVFSAVHIAQLIDQHFLQ
jgi:hypothetical protein